MLPIVNGSTSSYTNSMSNQRLQLTLQTAIGPKLWGTNYWIATQLLPANRPLLAASGRALPAGVLLLLLVARELPPTGWRLRIATLAVLNVGLFFVLLFVAAERLPGGVAAAAGAVGPIVVLLLGWPVLGLRPTWIGLATGALGLVGVAALVLGPAASLDAIGVAAAIGCAVSMATATVLGRRWGRPPLSLVSLTAWQLAIGGALVAPFVLAFEGVPPVPTAGNLGGFALMGLGGTAVAYALWIRGVTALPASSMQFLALLSPAVATAIGWIALGESLSAVQLTGAALVIAAVVAGQRVGSRSSRQPCGEARQNALSLTCALTPRARRRLDDARKHVIARRTIS
jgi:probable blue pigment (indigoidine) exporter